MKVFCVNSQEKIKSKKSVYLWNTVFDNFLCFLEHFSEADPGTQEPRHI